MSEPNEWTSIGRTADGAAVFAAPVGTPPPHLGRLRVVRTPPAIENGPAYAYGRDYSLAPGSTYGWVDEHGVMHTEVVADGPDFTDPVRRIRDRIAEIRHVVSLTAELWGRR